MPTRSRALKQFTIPTAFAAEALDDGIQCVEQEQSNWCWAACIQMVLAQTHPMRQAEIVNVGLSRADCEDHPSSAECNVPLFASADGRSIVRTLRTLAGSANHQNRPFAPAALRAAVARAPIIAGFDASSTGHVVVVSACDESADPMVWVSDPGTAPFQSAWKTYDQLLFGLDLGIGVWSSTIFDIGV